MSNGIKAVIDTNIWISALLSGSNALALADALDANLFVLVASNELLDELTRVIDRPKFAGMIPEERAHRILALVKEKADLVDLGSEIPSISSDPKDDMFLACALASDANYLVSGDNDLLSLKQYGVTEIINLTSFLRLLSPE